MNKMKMNKYKNFFISFFNLFVIIFFSIITKRTPTSSINELFEHIYNFIGGQFLMTSLINKPIDNLKKEFSKFTNKEQDFLQKVINGEIVVPDELKEKFDNFISMYKDYSYSYNTYGSNCNKFCQNVYVLYTLGQNIQKITNNELNVIIINVNKCIENYSNKDILINTVIKPYVFNMYNDNKVNIIPLYLVGEPGTGKTKFVNDISKILGASVYNLNMKNNTPVVNHGKFRHYDEFNTIYINDIILEAMLNTNNRNIIFFIDEFDKQLSSQDGECGKYLSLLNFQNVLSSQYLLDIEFKVPNILFIFAGNNKISDIKVNKDYTDSFKEHVKPLENRMIYVEFPDMTQDTKKSIVYKHLETSITDENVRKCIDYNFIDSIIEKDKNGGVRRLILQTNIYINKIVNNKFFEKTEWTDDTIDVEETDKIEETEEKFEKIN
jgi:ATP-dependent Lon protease